MEGNWFILIPVVAILAGVFKDWLKVRSQQRLLGVSTRELEEEVAALKKDRAAMQDRLQNLEAIVVSQTWDAVNDRSLPPPDRERRVAAAVYREAAPPDPAVANQQRAEQLARRLGG